MFNKPTSIIRLTARLKFNEFVLGTALYSAVGVSRANVIGRKSTLLPEKWKR